MFFSSDRRKEYEAELARQQQAEQAEQRRLQAERQQNFVVASNELRDAGFKLVGEHGFSQGAIQTYVVAPNGEALCLRVYHTGWGLFKLAAIA